MAISGGAAQEQAGMKDTAQHYRGESTLVQSTHEHFQMKSNIMVSKAHIALTKIHALKYAVCCLAYINRYCDCD